MTQAITTSIRLPHQIRSRLERISRRLNKGKNGVIIDALLDYFSKADKLALRNEARRQSLLVSGKRTEESVYHDDDFDLSDWKQ